MQLNRRQFVLGCLLTMPLSLRVNAAPSVTLKKQYHALNRLSFGVTEASLAAIESMGIDAYIEQQLSPERIPLSDHYLQRLAKLQAEYKPLGLLLTEFQTIKTQKNLLDKQAQLSVAAPDANASVSTSTPLLTQKAFYQSVIDQSASIRLLNAIESPRQLEEVMVDFWFNHFNVYANKGLTRILIADYERTAIRPYVFGKFRDLLGATAKHPAMLFYLDNWLSSATKDINLPATLNKPVKSGNQQQGLNENYARELMELHTLGVDGGYTQQDVTELARMLTGWTFKRKPRVDENNLFYFDKRRHDQGNKEWLGHQIRANGQQEGEFALDILAQHPATARHISRKLAEYFVTDKPPKSLVDALTETFLSSQGDIAKVLRTLLNHTAFWQPEHYGKKFKTPYRYVVSIARVLNVEFDQFSLITHTLKQMSMPLYGCPTPDGYSYMEAAWLNQETLSKRINFVTTLTAKQLKKHASNFDATSLSEASLSRILMPVLPDKTQQAIASQPQGLRPAMLLASPEFMRF